jgi:hypothetical protein
MEKWGGAGLAGRLRSVHRPAVARGYHGVPGSGVTGVVADIRMSPVGASSPPSSGIVLGWLIWSTCIQFLRDE